VGKVSGVEKSAMRLCAWRELRAHGISYNPPIREPRIVRRHIDGPYCARLNGTLQWLSPLERLLTKLGIWDAWDIEVRHSAVFAPSNSKGGGL